MLFLYFAFLVKAEIPEQYKYLANRALNQSKIKILNAERYESVKPGNYKFENIKFTLKRACSSPLTKDIKSYSIDDNINNNTFIAIVKRKKFDLPHDFTFLAPINNKIYDMSNLVASDETVSIYKATELTIFDIMTNFEYNCESSKELTATNRNIFWDSSSNEPVTTTIPGIDRFHLGLGGIGTFYSNFSTRFSSKYDLMIHSSLKFDLKLALLSKFNNNDIEISTEKVLSQIEEPFLDNTNSFQFLGVTFDLKFSCLFKTSTQKINLKIPEKNFRLFGCENYSGTKTITITSYEVIDSPWKIIKTKNLNEKFNLVAVENENNYYYDYLTAQILAIFSFSLKSTINFLDLKQSLNVGLKIPLNLTIENDNSHNMIHSETRLRMFYSFDGIYLDASKKRMKLIESSSNEREFQMFDLDDIGMTIGQIVEKDYYYLLNQSSYISSYLIENNGFYWEKSFPNMTQISVVESETKSARFYPCQTYGNNLNSHRSFLIIPASKGIVKWQMRVYYIEKYKYKNNFLNNYCYKHYQIETKSKTFNNEITGNITSMKNIDPIMTINDNKMHGSANIIKCKTIEIGKPFTRENNSPVIAKIPEDGKKRVILLFDKATNCMKIDEKATFYSEAMISSEQMTVGSYGESTPSNYEFSWTQIQMDGKKIKSVNCNLTISDQLVGLFSFNSYADYKDNYHMKIYIPHNINPVLKLNCLYINFGGFSSAKCRSLHNETILFSDELSGWNLGDMSMRAKFSIISEPCVTINSSSKSDYEILTVVENEELNEIKGSFTVLFQRNEIYKIVNLTSSKFSLINNYLIIKSNQITPLYSDVIKLSSDIFAIYLNKSYISLLVRNQNGNDNLNHIFEYIIVNKNVIESITNFKSEGEELHFTSSRNTLAFIVPIIHNNNNSNDYERYFFINNRNDLDFYILDFDKESKIIFVVCNSFEMKSSKMLYSYIILAKNELSVKFDARQIESLLTDENDSFNVTVICDSDDVKSIRCGSITQELIDGESIFTFYGKNNNIIEFFAVCKNESGSMCELAFIPPVGEYHLFKFPSPDGINITRRGMEYAIIQSPKNQPIKYYKTYKEPIVYIRSYTDHTNLKIEINDSYTVNQIPSNEFDEDYIMNNPHRSLCVYDSDGYKVPLSLNYFASNNLDSFMKSIGASSDFTHFDYNITKDGCIQVNLNIIITNEIGEFEPNIVDIPSSFEIIPPPLISFEESIQSSSSEDIPQSSSEEDTSSSLLSEENISSSLSSDDIKSSFSTKEDIQSSSEITYTSSSEFIIKRIILEGINGHSTIKTSQINLIEIGCPKSTLFFIHYMKGHKVSFYDFDNETITSITEKDSSKIFNFGESRGRIVIEKESEKANEFSYSYVIFDEVKIDQFSSNCSDILISSVSETNFTIKSPNYELNDFNISLQKSDNFCLWFTFPLSASVYSKIELPHFQSLIVDDVLIDTTEEVSKGFNFLYLLLSKESKLLSSDLESAIFTSQFVSPDNHLYEEVNDIYRIRSSNSILYPVSRESIKKNPPTNKGNKNKPKNNAAVIIGIVIGCVVLVAVIIVAIILAIKYNKRKSNSSSVAYYNNNNCIDKEILEHLTSDEWISVSKGLNMLKTKYIESDKSNRDELIANILDILGRKTFDAVAMASIYQNILFYVRNDEDVSTSKLSDESVNSTVNFCIEKIIDKDNESLIFDILDECCFNSGDDFVFDIMYPQISITQTTDVLLGITSFFLHHLTLEKLNGDLHMDVDSEKLFECIEPLLAHKDEQVRKVANKICTEFLPSFVLPKDDFDETKSSSSKSHDKHCLISPKLISMIENTSDIVACERGLEKIETVLIDELNKQGENSIESEEFSDLFTKIRDLIDCSNMNVVLSVSKVVLLSLKLVKDVYFLSVDCSMDIVKLANFSQREIRQTTLQIFNKLYNMMGNFFISNIFLPSFKAFNTEGRKTAVFFLRNLLPKIEIDSAEFTPLIASILSDKDEEFRNYSTPIIQKFLEIDGGIVMLRKEANHFPPSKKSKILKSINDIENEMDIIYEEEEDYDEYYEYYSSSEESSTIEVKIQKRLPLPSAKNKMLKNDSKSFVICPNINPLRQKTNKSLNDEELSSTKRDATDSGFSPFVCDLNDTLSQKIKDPSIRILNWISNLNSDDLKIVKQTIRIVYQNLKDDASIFINHVDPLIVSLICKLHSLLTKDSAQENLIRVFISSLQIVYENYSPFPKDYVQQIVYEYLGFGDEYDELNGIYNRMVERQIMIVYQSLLSAISEYNEKSEIALKLFKKCSKKVIQKGNVAAICKTLLYIDRFFEIRSRKSLQNDDLFGSHILHFFDSYIRFVVERYNDIVNSSENRKKFKVNSTVLLLINKFARNYQSSSDF